MPHRRFGAFGPSYHNFHGFIKLTCSPKSHLDFTLNPLPALRSAQKVSLWHFSPGLPEGAQTARAMHSNGMDRYSIVRDDESIIRILTRSAMLLSIDRGVTPLSFLSSLQDSGCVAQRRTSRLAGFLTPALAARVGSSVPGLTGTAAFAAGVGTLAPTFLAFVNQVVSTNPVLSASVTNTGSAAISSALFRGMKKGAQGGI